MTTLLESYAKVAGEDVIDHLRQLSVPLKGMKVLHINSTRIGGGVAEILTKLVPLQQELGLDVKWEVILGRSDFYQCTKYFHNALQGSHVEIPQNLLKVYEQTNNDFADEFREMLEEADFVFIHDPQPAAVLKFCPNRKGRWIWRCHIDGSHPNRQVWKYLRDFVSEYDASIFSLAVFSQALSHPQYLIPPSIDPLSDKNKSISAKEVRAVFPDFDLDPDRPIILQVSRFDKFKDPIGVIQSYKLTKRFIPTLQLVLAGGEATDDPEGEAVLKEVRGAASGDPDIHVLLLPADAHTTINALQRASDIVLQKSIKEGFGLTVTEAMWKSKPVIGGNTGGIRLQVIDHHTGFLVNTPEGAALRIRYLLHHRNKLKEMGKKARDFVRENFLLTRQLREHLTLMVGLIHGAEDRIVLG